MVHERIGHGTTGGHRKFAAGNSTSTNYRPADLKIDGSIRVYVQRTGVLRICRNAIRSLSLLLFESSFLFPLSL